MSTGSETPNSLGVAGDLLEHIVADAIDEGASDVDLEPHAGSLRVRFRIDGVLRDVAHMGRDVAPILLTRLKTSAELEISDQVQSQEGRAFVIFDGRPMDLRVSISRVDGRYEKASIRILDASPANLDMHRLGLDDDELNRLEQILAESKGMVLVAGPKESGKTTTLYCALRQMQSHAANIVTIEDRIEYRLDGIKQVRVTNNSRLTIASALRSILRQKPDAVLVGEIGDLETAAIAIRASMSGHMVLSTVDAVDIQSAFAQLARMGIEASALVYALRAAVAQRLVRRLCPECSVAMPTSAIPSSIAWSLKGRDTSQLRAPVGCAACRGTGYRGRMAIAELLVVDGTAHRVMSRAARGLEIDEIMRSSGMKTLWERGLDRVLAGLTSIDELVANVPPTHGETELRSGRALSACG